MFNKMHHVLINFLMTVLLLGILALPISSLALMELKPATTREQREVLSATDSTEKKEEINFEDELRKYMEEESRYYEQFLNEPKEDIRETTPSVTTQENELK